MSELPREDTGPIATPSDDFVTVGSARIPKGSGWPHADAIVTELMQRCHVSDVVQVLDELEEHVAAMGIADRYRRDRFAGQSLVQQGIPADTYDIIAGEKLNEAGHKRAVLLQSIRRLRSELHILFASLGSLRIDIEATNMNDDGTNVPQPSRDALRADDLLEGHV